MGERGNRDFLLRVLLGSTYELSIQTFWGGGGLWDVFALSCALSLFLNSLNKTLQSPKTNS